MERFVMEVVAGIDLGGTETKFGLVNREGVLLASGSIPTRPVSDYRAFFDRLCRTLEKEISGDRKSTRLNSSHVAISYAVFCLKKKTTADHRARRQSARGQR